MERLPTKNSSNRKKGQMPGDDKEATFIGRKATTYDVKKEIIARRMEKQGYSRDEIWWETGTFRNYNGDWRQEISDRGLKLSKLKDIELDKTYKFKDLIDHKLLFKAYPFLKDYDIRVTDQTQKGAAGTWSPNDKTIQVHPDYWDRFTAVHELAHAAQNAEKPEGNKYGDINAAIERAIPGIDSYAAYHKEMDARTAEERMDYEDWKLKALVPTNTDTPYMTIQDRPMTGPKYDTEFKHTDTDFQKDFNPLKTVPAPHYDGAWDDPMQNDINKSIRGNLPPNMKDGDMPPLHHWKGHKGHTHPHPNNTTTSVKPKPRPANLGNKQSISTKPKPRPANLGNKQSISTKPKPRPANLGQNK